MIALPPSSARAQIPSRCLSIANFVESIGEKVITINAKRYLFSLDEGVFEDSCALRAAFIPSLIWATVLFH
jgi:hypothetical protein